MARLKFPTLYSKDSSENTRVWWMEQNGDQYTTHSGVKGGAITVSAPTVAEPKNPGKANATSGEEQAKKEILADYKKKKKDKYFEDEADIDTKRYFKPMLAKEFEDYKDKIEYPVIIQRKLNGHRLIITKNGLFTRKGEKYESIPHIWESIKGLFLKYPEAVLDGEIYNFTLREKLNELSSLVRKTKNITQEDLDKSRAICEFHCYDGWLLEKTKELNYENRISELKPELDRYKFVKVLLGIKVNNEKELLIEYKKILNDKEEGGIIRLLKHEYENKRSISLLKLKPYEDSEGEIIDIQSGEGNWSGKAKVVTLRLPNGKVFDATVKGTMEEAEDILKNKTKYIGKEVTYIFNGYTGKGTPNYATVDFKNCFK